MKLSVPGFRGERLRQAREAIGLSITSLADLIGVSKQAVSQYERDIDSPGPAVFDKMRSVLKQEPYFFLKPPANFARRTCFFRSMASATKTARTKAEVWQSWTRELLGYIGEFIEFPVVSFPTLPDLPEEPNKLGMASIEVIAGEVREFWNLGDGPIPNLTAVCESNGAMIVRQTLDAETLDALSSWLEPEDYPLIVLNADKRSAVRSRLDLAHEIGHLVFHRSVTREQLQRTDVFKLIEEQAFRFASAFLLPEHSFLEDLYSLSLDGLRSLKPKWKVSIAMMIERLKDLGVISDEQRRKLRINYSVRQWNKTEPFDDEIEVERPMLITRAVRLMVERELQTVDQISANSGFGPEWIHRLLSIPPNRLSPDPDPRIIEFKRRA
jgi:Zn-dependent peptidase ImmA (M78 family)/transcriptional regulator with XRE-family HTH domain